MGGYIGSQTSVALYDSYTKKESDTLDLISYRIITKRAMAEVGLTLVDGSFESGAVVHNTSEVVLQELTGKTFGWGGTIPVGGYIVPAGSTPATSGGIGAGAWVDRTQDTYPHDMLAPDGYGRIGSMSYAQLRAYTGQQTTVSVYGITNVFDGAAGIFKVNDSDTTSDDDGGTILVDALGRRWYRVYSGPVDLKWFGAAVDGITDDSAAIFAARQVSAGCKPLFFNGKTYASGYWENLAPLAEEWIVGSPTSYAADTASTKPVISGKLFNGTMTAGAGYAGYFSRFDAYTKSGLDVASTATSMFSMQSYSNNSSGTDFNNTNQVAVVANASAMDSKASASVEAINAIAHSSYSGPVPHIVVGLESDVSGTNPAGFFGDTGKTYSVGVSANWVGSLQDGTIALAASTSNAHHTWCHTAVLSGASRTGITITRNGSLTPESGIWVASASTFGIYVGAKSKHQMNPGSGGDYKYKPAVGIALGQTGGTSSASHNLRFVATDSSSIENNLDLYTDSSNSLLFSYAGTPKAAAKPDGGFVFGAAGFSSGSNNVTIGPGSGGSAFSISGTTTATQISFQNGNGAVGSITTTGSATAYNTSSDYRLKKNVKPITNALNKILKLKPCTFEWNVSGISDEGFLAHELAEVFPNAVTGEKDATDENGNPQYQSIDTSFIISSLVAAVQELNDEVERLKISIAASA